MAGNPRHPSVITMRTGVKKDGRILARQVKALFNSGAYAAFKPAPSVNLGGTSMGAGVYRIPESPDRGVLRLQQQHPVWSRAVTRRAPDGLRRRVAHGHDRPRARAGSGRPPPKKSPARRRSPRQRPPSRARARERHARGGAQGQPLRRAKARTVDRARHGDDASAHRRGIHERPGAPGDERHGDRIDRAARHGHRRSPGSPPGRRRGPRLVPRRGGDRGRQYRRLRDRFRRGRKPRHAHRGPRRVSRRREAQGADRGGGGEARDTGGLAGGSRPRRREGRADAGGVALLRREGPRAPSRPSPPRSPRSQSIRRPAR